MRATPELNLFDQVLAPLGRKAFLADYWSQSFLRQPGQPGRFNAVFSWDDLNAILGERRLEPPRLRLVREGETVDPQKYLDIEGPHPRLKAGSLVNLFSQGATLILDSVEELAPGVRKLADSFQEVLSDTTLVYLIAGWRTQKGLEVHWDIEDNFILQIAGRKHWQVYRPTREHPLKNDLENPSKPSGPPFWEGMLEDGDMMYLPRGWWHVAIPIDEPCLHLAVTVMPPTGADLLAWFRSRLQRHADVRKNLPSLAGAEEQRAQIARMRALMLKDWDDGLLEEFLASWKSARRPRPRIHLPLAPLECAQPITAQTRIRLAADRRLSPLASADGGLFFYANGVRWNCPAELAPTLGQLSDTAAVSVSQLCATLADDSAHAGLMTFLTALAMGGAVYLEGPAGDVDS